MDATTPFISAIGYFDSPTPAYEWAADYAAAARSACVRNPAVPIGGAGDGVPLTVLPPPVASQDIEASEQTLLADGMATYRVDKGGRMRVQRAVNLYTANPAGQPDNSFQQVETN